MTKLRAVALVALALVAGACTTKENTNTTTTTPPPADVFTGTYTLQGFVADATNGARIGGSDLQLFVIQGATVRTPSRLNSAATDPLLGEFAFAGIPADYNGGNKQYKVVAVKPGYQRFEGEIDFTVADGSFHDTVFNVIGNIYMFPIGAPSPTYTFTVTYNGKPVPNATVLLDPAPNSNDPLYNVGHAIPSTTGYIASVSATTDVNGVATFSGGLLALGAAYRPQVLPLTFTYSAGTLVPLARFETPVGPNQNIVPGVSVVDQRIAMSDLVATASNLYAVSASNLAAGAVASNGALVITFNAPVTLKAGATGFGATIAGNTASTIGTPAVFANLSTDGKTLTLTPNLSAPLGAADSDVVITYTNGSAFLEANDYPAIDRLLFGDVTLQNGVTTLSGAVQMRAP